MVSGTGCAAPERQGRRLQWFTIVRNSLEVPTAGVLVGPAAARGRWEGWRGD